MKRNHQVQWQNIKTYIISLILISCFIKQAKANEYAENKYINHITIVLGHENQHTSTVNNHSVKHFLNKRNKIELYFKEYSLET